VHRDIDRVLFSEEEIRQGIDRVSRQVTSLYRGSEFTVVCVLKGSCIFVSDLVRLLPIPLEMAFVSAGSYRDSSRPSALEIRTMPSSEEVRGRRVLLLDDILDSGRTLTAVREALLRDGADEVRTGVFLDKPERREVPLEPDFRVFEVEDLFVVGYGLDYAGRYRNLPYVGSLRPELLDEGASK
jgi:hypoxanthine phosphoribosyltransferase